ncbi:response regulator [Methanogenium sp. S4BF]|uniref:response regulator n=1 Tax=Methanogenium sp. S4BF TaxID=1789226 RepID=UPI0024168490|nr:response regulator [Methanogenium sp. S4BF]WFN35565.1 response regulator [Methanogenium sp. S4BF]
MNRNSVFSCGKKLAIVEDEEIVSMMLENVLQNVGYSVVTFSSGEELLGGMADFSPDLILMDIGLDGALDGIQTADTILSEYGVPVVFLTGHSDDEIMQSIIRLSPDGCLTKPFREKELFSIIEVALSRHRTE